MSFDRKIYVTISFSLAKELVFTGHLNFYLFFFTKNKIVEFYMVREQHLTVFATVILSFPIRNTARSTEPPSSWKRNGSFCETNPTLFVV